MPASPEIRTSSQVWNGSSTSRYRSRFCCSSDIGRIDGRSRYAMTSVVATAIAMISPKMTNSTSRVPSTFVNTLPKCTERKNSRSV